MSTFQIAACDLAGGQIQVFATQSDGSILSRWKESADPTSAWTAWVPFQGLPQDSASAICTVTLPDRRVQLFALDPNGNVFTCWKSTADSNSGWTGWTPFQLLPLPFLLNGLILLCAAALPDKRNQLFTTDGSGKIFTCWQYTADPDSGWTGWAPFSQPGSDYYVLVMCTGTLSDHRIQLFAGSPGIVTCWKESQDPNSDWSDWVSFQDVPGGFSSFSLFATPVPGGRLQLFTTDPYGNIFTCWKNTADSNSGWGPWEAFQGIPKAGTAMMCAATLSDQRTQLFAVDLAGNNWTCWKESTHPNAAWSAWEAF